MSSAAREDDQAQAGPLRGIERAYLGGKPARGRAWAGAGACTSAMGSGAMQRPFRGAVTVFVKQTLSRANGPTVNEDAGRMPMSHADLATRPRGALVRRRRRDDQGAAHAQLQGPRRRRDNLTICCCTTTGSGRTPGPPVFERQHRFIDTAARASCILWCLVSPAAGTASGQGAVSRRYRDDQPFALRAAARDVPQRGANQRQRQFVADQAGAVSADHGGRLPRARDSI